MSLVIGYIDPRQVIIAGDGRGVDPDGNIIDENIHKVKHINDNVIIGFTGEQNVCLEVIQKLQQDLFRTVYLSQNFTVEPIAHKIYNILDSTEKFTSKPINFLIGGINQRGGTALWSITTTPYLIMEVHLMIGEQQYSVAALNPPDREDGVTLFQQQLQKISPSESVLTAIQRTIKIVSQTSSTVNDHVFSETICL